MPVNLPDLTKIHWQLNVALMGGIFSIFSLIYNSHFIYYGLFTFAYGVVSVSVLPALEGLDEKNKWRNYLIVQGIFTFIWVFASLYFGLIGSI